MDIEILNTLLVAGEHGPVYDLIKNYCKDTAEYIRQYDPKQHKVHDPIYRKDKIVFKPTGERNNDGTQQLRSDTVKVARISIPAQKQIVKVASGILCTNPITLDFTGKDAKFDALKTLWDDNKLDFKSKKLAKLMMAETECAELWYKKDDKIKMLILSRSLGDSLYPVFDIYGDLIAFGRSYEAKVVDEATFKAKEATFLEIYTEKEVWQGDNRTGSMELLKKSHGFTKIPVIYYSQEFPEWWDVQESIERVETILSNLADTNDYFGSPTAVASGNVLSYADKGEAGKMVQLDEGGKIEYLTWDQVPEAIKMELEGLLKNIFGLSDTPLLSPQELKGMFGSAPSGYAIKLMFTAAHMKAREHEENFGESMQRRINLMKSFYSAEALDIKPKFTYFLPQNEAEEIAVIVTAYTNGTISLETAVKRVAEILNISDADAELALVKAENETKQANDLNKAKMMQPVNPAFMPVN